MEPKLLPSDDPKLNFFFFPVAVLLFLLSVSHRCTTSVVS